MNKKIFSLLIVFALSASFAIGQGTTSLGILAGVNFQNLNGTDFEGKKLENDLITGYHVGLNVQIPIVTEFYFQPGVLFTTKGAEDTDEGFTARYSLSYVEVPLNFVYKGALGGGLVLVGFGPYVAYGIMGKVTVESGETSTEMDIEFKNTVEITDSNDVPYFKAMDAGANIFVGYEMSNGIFLQLNTQFGMLKINPEYKGFEDDESSLKNTGFGLSLGYRF